MSPARDPGETFLGVSMSVDPFAMLGLPRTRHSDAVVLQALGKRMSEIAGHARSQTPEANEIRLALHAAAAQLLDPQLQELLLSQEAPPSRSRAAALTASATRESQTEVAASPEPVSEVAHPLAHDALMVVAASGGWNASAMRRLAILAHARGIPSSEIPGVIASVLASPMPMTTPSEPIAGIDDRSSRVGSIVPAKPSSHGRRASLGVQLAPWIMGTLTVISLSFVWARLTESPERQHSQVEPTIEEQSDEAPSVAADPIEANPKLTPAGPEIVDVRTAARELIRLSGQRDTLDDARLDAFQRSHQQIAERWTELGTDDIGAIHNAVLELLYKVSSDPSRAQTIIASIGEPLRAPLTTPDELRAWVWSVGTLSRLSIERNLHTAIDSAIIGRLAGAMGDGVRTGSQGFNDGAMVALARSAQRLTAQQSGEPLWRAWLDQLGAVADPGGAVYTQTVLDAIEAVLLSDDDPTQSRAIFLSVEALASAVKLQPESLVAERLVAWHADDRITASDLSVVMRSMVSRSRIEGIDETLILSVGSGVSERMAVRASLESVLLGRDSGAAESVAAWQSIADQQLDRAPASRPVEQVARAVIMSRLSEAARATLWGNETQAQSVLANLSGDLDQMIRQIDESSTDYLGGDNASEWALKYIDAKQNIPVRQALLAELTRGNRTLGPVAAEVIVRDAFLGTPASVRAQAREVVLLYASSPAVLNAVLEYLPRIPRVESSSQLIESVALTRLPAVTSPSWSLRARQSVVDELLRRIAGVGEGQAIDFLVGQLRSSYEARLARTVLPDNSPDEAIELADAAEQLSAQWRQLAEQELEDVALLSQLDDLDHRRVGRLLLTIGSLDRFAAHQSGAVEAMALLVMAESPASRAEAEAIVAELSKKRRESRTILEQIVACEEAAVRLWKLRLRGSVPS